MDIYTQRLLPFPVPTASFSPPEVSKQGLGALEALQDPIDNPSSFAMHGLIIFTLVRLSLMKALDSGLSQKPFIRYFYRIQ